VSGEYTGEFSGPYECRRCGFETQATVRATGRRTWTPRAPHESSERGAGAESADAVAEVVASRTLMFVRCPRCHRRDPSAFIYQLQVILGALLAGGGAFALSFLGMIKLASGVSSYMLPVALVAGATTCLGVWWTYRRAWVAVDDRVRLSSPES